MKVNNVTYLMIAVMLLFVACTPHSLEKMDYIKYVEKERNGLRKNTTLGVMQYFFQYKPTDYMIALEKHIGDSSQNARSKQLAGTVWFNIQFKKTTGNNSPLREGISSLAEYNARQDYYLNQAARDIQLFYKGDTLKPMSYSFETNYNLTPIETIVVGFDINGTESPDEDMQLVFFDRIFGNGIVKTVYKKEDIKELPVCKF